MKNFIKNYPLHILFFPAFSVLMMAANNVGQIDLIVILRPLIVSTLLSLGIFFLSSTILNDRHRAGTLSFIITFFILTYGHFYTLMQDRIIGNWVIGTHFYTLLLLGLVCILFIYLLVVKRKNIRNFTQILNILTLVLTGFQVGTIGVYKVKAEILPEEETQVQNETFLHVDPERMPDVYFIILDKYGRSDAIKSLYSYDNSDFIAALKGLGFWVADCSRSNYDFTVMSMSSQLNMAYIEDLTDNPNLKTTSALIRNNKVHQAFDDLGYTTIAFDTGFT